MFVDDVLIFGQVSILSTKQDIALEITNIFVVYVVEFDVDFKYLGFHFKPNNYCIKAWT